jgi:hypothetical protein
MVIFVILVGIVLIIDAIVDILIISSHDDVQCPPTQPNPTQHNLTNRPPPSIPTKSTLGGVAHDVRMTRHEAVWGWQRHRRHDQQKLLA